jgi:hypothetical protein
MAEAARETGDNETPEARPRVDAAGAALAPGDRGAAIGTDARQNDRLVAAAVRLAFEALEALEAIAATEEKTGDAKSAAETRAEAAEMTERISDRLSGGTLSSKAICMWAVVDRGETSLAEWWGR